MQEQIAQVRRFNRTITQRAGALSDRFFARDMPLGEARVLWELGADGCEVRTLRQRLELDSGQLSRVLRSLEAAGMARVTASEVDGRIRVARLTKRGLAERAALDARSDEQAASILDPLDDEQRDRLVDAMRRVERLLAFAEVELREVDPGNPDARQCLRAYLADLDARARPGLDSSHALPVGPEQLRAPSGCLLIAYLRAERVGCGGVKHPPGEPAEIKRMWVSSRARGLGIGRRLLCALEERARVAGATDVRLDTNRALTEAIALYRSTGYEEIPAFNEEPFADFWFHRRL